MNRISRCDWLPEMELSCPLGIRALSRKENLSCFGVLSHLINPLLTKLVRSRYWPRSFFLRVYGPRLRLARKELGQYPAILTEQTWSITHMYFLCR